MKYPETARRLMEAMNDKNIKPVELVEKTGITKGSISQYMNGRNRPNNINAGKIADVLDVDPMWLMGFDVEKKAKRYILVDDSTRILLEEADKMDAAGLDRLLMYAKFINAMNEKKEGGPDVD